MRSYGQVSRSGKFQSLIVDRLGIAAGHMVSVQSLQHTMCAASVDVVNGINNYEIIVKVTPDRGGNQNFFYSTIPHLHRFECRCSTLCVLLPSTT
jgi:hypothetical protein